MVLVGCVLFFFLFLGKSVTNCQLDLKLVIITDCRMGILTSCKNDAGVSVHLASHFLVLVNLFMSVPQLLVHTDQPFDLPLYSYNIRAQKWCCNLCYCLKIKFFFLPLLSSWYSPPPTSIRPTVNCSMVKWWLVIFFFCCLIDFCRNVHFCIKSEAPPCSCSPSPLHQTMSVEGTADSEQRVERKAFGVIQGRSCPSPALLLINIASCANCPNSIQTLQEPL